ncbi:probable leucine-rich repeat receptor-like serine/threonine-protein kinase At3g14840 isoform X4 [Vitis riparia]|uniref:probable leucine-rich repeat receptor-like serine/threonine-protein kinase At3g14840 isoform X4 n=1 Tax=Vitis riparia TaxID=96939 RepID=UPI00155A7CAA|nr:probable leucine-rich repeat receptor-like serine/threonine-protein kinase At3g14840 isoform X4 [Vitis riparia]
MPSINSLLSSLLIAFTFFTTLTFSATLLPTNEVEALQEIAKTLGKTDWNFSADPCGGEWGWATKNPVKGSENAVTCSCTNDTVCHVVSIVLKTQNLPGSLPPELVKLPYLQEIDLTRNYLNGSIPPEWGTMQLVNISLMGNRVTGSIPKELGNISTLANLIVESNQLSGVLPQELGNLSSIERILLASNNFTGELPETFAGLTTLRDFRVADNQFTGKIPNFIQNWTKLEKLVIQGSGFSGPIPSGIALLTNITDLRISDLNGTEPTFPPLSHMRNLKTLILRSCSIVGPLPDYLGEMAKLKTLDLSFNKLTGEIPSSFVGLSKADYIDLSYNNFTSESSRGCQERSVNLFGSSSGGNNSGIVSCLRSFNCPKKFYSMHINCGGKEVIVDGNTTYEDDTDSGGPSKFYQSRTNWAFSSTGHFMDDDHPTDSFIGTNVSRLTMENSGLYTTARLSALSLTYYGFCLENGNYTVKLHFAEITFTDDKTYSSLGRRLFDVYVQDELVLKDFNIEDEARGVSKEILKFFTAIVTNNTLEIRFYWAGKGTTGIPVRGVYGPLISAISVDPDFIPPTENGSSSISVGVVVGIVAGVILLVFLLIGILWWRGCLRRKDTLEQELKGLDLQTGLFTLRQIKAATNNFDAANKIGEGGFGSVYKGVLSDGTVIAVKQLSSKSKQGNREFVTEIGMISALQHPHLVKLYGCCIEGNQLLLIYEYMENNSLARALFGPEECQLQLDWPTRHRICVGIARGLAYLHEESRLKIVHRDIKATNVLLDKDLNPKISDFGLAKLDEEDNTHISTRIAGTFGYMAPEYAMRGYLTDKADVYSFGIVALEIVSGRSNTTYRPKEECTYLLDGALSLKEKGSLMDLVDPRLGPDFNKEEVMAMLNIALLCTNISSAVRPAMSSVVSMLEGRTAVQDIVSDPSAPSDDLKLKEMKEHYRLIQEESMGVSESKAQSMGVSESKAQSMPDGPWTASSSIPDLYPVNLDSEYLEKRD